MSLKMIIARRKLNKQTENIVRSVQVHNFDSAETIGVLWSLEEEEAFLFIQEKLKEKKNIQLESLCFIPGKATELPENSFAKTELSWLGFPKSGLPASFAAKKLDILIDLSVNKKFPMMVIAALSPATFKIGYAGAEMNVYDLNIDISQCPEALYLAQQIVNYTELINKKNA